MPSTSPGYAITIRVSTPHRAVATGELVMAVAHPGGSPTALGVVESPRAGITVDVTCDTVDADQIADAVR